MKKLYVFPLSLISLSILVGISCASVDQQHYFRGKKRSAKSAHGAASAADEQRCVNKGWEKITFTVAGLHRQVLWKGPSGPWKKGAIIVMHGGGANYTQWCYAPSRTSLVKPQVDFSEEALIRGFAVFLLDSTDDIVMDVNGRTCGKRFDATIVDNGRDNVDLPYIEKLLVEIIPDLRPEGSTKAIFATGESTGGFMTIRAGTHFDGIITAFAPGAAADPYGTYFDCNTSLSSRESAKGAGFDRETKQEITETGACESVSYDHEMSWESMNPKTKPAFKSLHHADDGIVDISCQKKAAELLVEHGYKKETPFIMRSSGKRNVLAHLWRKAYNEPALNFFERQLK